RLACAGRGNLSPSKRETGLSARLTPFTTLYPKLRRVRRRLRRRAFISCSSTALRRWSVAASSSRSAINSASLRSARSWGAFIEPCNRDSHVRTPAAARARKLFDLGTAHLPQPLAQHIGPE